MILRATTATARPLVLLALSLLAAPAGGTATADSPRSSAEAPRIAAEVEHLQAFARLYGYVRYFHPSDEASAIDWNAFAVHGSEQVLAVEESGELARVLRDLFAPFAAAVQVLAPGEEEAPPWSPESTDGLSVIAWQHLGDGLTSGYAGVYESVRLHRPRVVPVRGRGQPAEMETVTPPLFPEHPAPGEAFRGPLGAGLRCVVPLALWGDARLTYPRPTASLAPLGAALDAVTAEQPTADETPARVAGVVIAWNVLQHFYPYFDVVDVDWEAVLAGSLERAIAETGAAAHLANLELLAAALEDGHAGAHDGRRHGTLPLRLGWVEERLVVLASADPRIERGDVLVAIDGVGASGALVARTARLSGTLQWRRYKALDHHLIGSGEAGTRAPLTLAREGGAPFEVTVERVDSAPDADSTLPPLHQLEDGIWYVDLSRASVEELQPVVGRLAAAPGVVFDMRRYPQGSAKMVVRHLLDGPDTSDRWMRIPQIVYPDRERLVGWDEDGWELQPLAPHIAGEVAFLTGPGAISYAESILGLVEHHRLGEIVGETTAGTNGNINFVNLPGRFAIVWTGMKVVKHDGSQHHLVGIRPTVLVSPTLAGLRAERDEQLEVALATVRAAITGRAAGE